MSCLALTPVFYDNTQDPQQDVAPAAAPDAAKAFPITTVQTYALMTCEHFVSTGQACFVG